MKTFKKIAGLLVALVMVFSVTATASASSNGSITINNATAGNTYKVYKVFDAVVGNGGNISYKLVEGKTTAPEGFTVDPAGNVSYTGSGTNDSLTENDIDAIAKYVTANDLVTSQSVSEDETSVVFTGLSNGYYYITTTTGTAVTITSTNPNATVNDKNEAPKLDKKITGVEAGSYDNDGLKALAQVGTKVTYTATIKVENGAENYVFHDKMDNTLAYNADVSVAIEEDTIVAGEDTYTVDDVTGTDDTFKLTFDNDWIKAQVGKTITIMYSATVTSDALTINPAKNTASLHYGDENVTDNTVTSETPEVYNAKFTVIKTDGNNPLAGAGFVIKNNNNQYYKYDADAKKVSWVANIAEATECITKIQDNKAEIVFTGLADGTYTLVEKTVPDGYNKAADASFTIVKGNYEKSNLEQATKVANNAGSLLPSTGGMGTTLFYLLGAILVIGAGVLLVVRRRMSVKK